MEPRANGRNEPAGTNGGDAADNAIIDTETTDTALAESPCVADAVTSSVTELMANDEASRRRLPSMRGIVASGLVLGAADVALVRAAAGDWPRSLLGGALMAGFVIYAMRSIVRLRRRYRPDVAPTSQRAPSATPPPGGWANPTAGQSFVARVRRILEATRRPVRRRR